MPALGHLAHRPFFLTVKTTGLRGFAAKFAVFAAGADCGAEQRFFEHGACSFPLGFLFIIPKRDSCFNCVLLGMGAAPWANGQGAHAEYCAHGVRRHARNKYGFFPCSGRLDDGEQPHQHSKHSKAQRQMCDSARGTREISGCVSARTCKNTHAPIRLRAAMHSGARYAGAQVLAFWHAAVTSSGRFMAYCLRGEAVLGVKRFPRKENKII